MYHQNRLTLAMRYVTQSLAIYPFRNRAFFRALWRAIARLARRAPS